jgi:hypothetical protein
MSADRVVVEGLDGHGRVQWRERLALNETRRRFTIGRSIDADVTLDDPFAAEMHASLEVTPDGRIFVNDLGSVNGLVICGKRLRGTCDFEVPDNVLQIGRTRLRVRTGAERLEPERPYQVRPSSFLRDPAWIAAIGAVIGGLQLVYNSWLSAPRDLALSIVILLTAAISIGAIWVAIWGLLSRVMQGEWRWLRHTAIFLGVSTAFIALMGVLELSAFAFALPLPNSRYTWIGAFALAWALCLHLIHASSLTTGRAALVACVISLVLAGGNDWLQERYQTRNVNYIPAHMHIYPPAVRLRPSETMENYLKGLESLRELADSRLIDAIANDPNKDDER